MRFHLQQLKQSVPLHSAPVGATLVEVLMSLLIMSIGIVSVFTLFPISILSSIKASQLTNTKLLEENVIELLRSNPQLVTGTKVWQPSTPYNVGQIVTAPPRHGQILSSNGLYFRCINGGTSGAVEPQWPFVTGSTVTESTGGVIWSPVSGGGVDSSSPGTRRYAYAIDPLARDFSGNSNFGDSTCPRFNLTDPTFLNVALTNLIPFFELPDNWTVTGRAIPTNVTATSVQFGNEIDLTSVVAESFRVTLVSINGSHSASRLVASLGPGNRINLSGPNLPTELVNNFGEARIEAFNRRYTWMLTVQRSLPSDPSKPQVLGPPKIQCAIYFNRSYGADEETVYSYIATNSDSVNVTGSPSIAQGRYAFDLKHCRWLKIASVSGSNIAFDSSIFAPPPSPDSGNILFPPTVIRVFDIEL